MSEQDVIRTTRRLQADLHYIIEFGGYDEGFKGKDATEWFWACMDAIKRVIETWHIKKQPRCIRILVRREEGDKGEYPWLLVKNFRITPTMPWIDLDQLEQDRELLYMIGQALGLAWRNRHAKEIIAKHVPNYSFDPLVK